MGRLGILGIMGKSGILGGDFGMWGNLVIFGVIITYNEYNEERLV